MKLMLVFKIHKLYMTASVNWDLPLREKSMRFCSCSHSLKIGPDGIFEGSFCKLKKSQHSEIKKALKPRKWNTPKRNIHTSNLENKTLRNDIPEPFYEKGPQPSPKDHRYHIILEARGRICSLRLINDSSLTIKYCVHDITHFCFYYDLISTVFIIAMISVTSPIAINVPTRELLTGETKSSFVERFQHLNNENNACKQVSSL